MSTHLYTETPKILKVIIAERHSTYKATNLAVRILGWRGVAPTYVPLENAVKSVASVQTFILLRDAIKKILFTKKVAYT